MCSRCFAPATLTTSSTTARRRTWAGRWKTPSARSTCFLFHSHTPKPPDPHLAIRFKTTEPQPGQLPSRTEDSSRRMPPPVSVLPPKATDPPRPSSLPVRSTRRPETLPLMTNVLRHVELLTVPVAVTRPPSSRSCIVSPTGVYPGIASTPEKVPLTDVLVPVHVPVSPLVQPPAGAE